MTLIHPPKKPVLPRSFWPEASRSSQKLYLKSAGPRARNVVLATCYLVGTPYARAERAVWAQNTPHVGMIRDGLEALALSAYFDEDATRAWLNPVAVKPEAPHKKRHRPVRVPRTPEAPDAAALRDRPR